MIAIRPNVMLDSGAYTAWRSGQQIVLADYMRFIEQNSDWITNYVALDVIIPGDPKTAAAASMVNYKIMRNAGFNPLPVLHAGESIDWLKQMLDQGADYVALSASSLVVRSQVDEWYALIWSHLVNGQGQPLLRCHALGEGRFRSLRKFPWQSTDTASWAYSGAMFGHTVIKGHTIDVKTIADLDGIDTVYMNELLASYNITVDALASDCAREIKMWLAAKSYLHAETIISAQYPKHVKLQGFLTQPLTVKALPKITAFHQHFVLGNIGRPNFVVALSAGLKNLLVSYAHVMPSISKTYKDFLSAPDSILTDPAYSKIYNRLSRYLPC